MKNHQAIWMHQQLRNIDKAVESIREAELKLSKELYEVYTYEDYAGKGKVVICSSFDTALRMARHLAKAQKMEVDGRFYTIKSKYKRISTFHWQWFCDHIYIRRIRIY